MRLDDYRESDNVGDQRGQSFGGGFGGGGGGGLGLILALVGSRFGIGGVIVVILGALLFGFNPFGGGGSGVVSPQEQTEVGHNVATKACNVDAASTFSCKVLASAEDVWAPIFQQNGQRLTPAALIFYSNRGSSGCGAAQSAMGPFYCPTDRRIYLDTDFFNELRDRFGAAGDFAQAYVIAHEFGHHIQDQLGTLGSVHDRQQAAGEAAANALQVRVELQADCYAGVYAANARDAKGKLMEPGDVEEGLRAANAIGDDTLQRSAGRTPVPDSFTHGTSAERVAWLKRGLETGDPARCDTFAGSID